MPILLRLLISISLGFTPPVSASNGNEDALPQLKRSFEKAGSLEKFIDTLAPNLTPADFQFLKSKLIPDVKKLAPKLKIENTNTLVVQVQEMTVHLRVQTSGAREFVLNNKTIKFQSGESLQSRYKKIMDALPSPSPKHALFQVLLPEAHAFAAVAIVILTLGLIVLGSLIARGAMGKCYDIIHASNECLDQTKDLKRKKLSPQQITDHDRSKLRTQLEAIDAGLQTASTDEVIKACEGDMIKVRQCVSELHVICRPLGCDPGMPAGEKAAAQH